MPLTKEYRLFILDGRPIFSTEYWDEGHYDNSEMQMGVFDSLSDYSPAKIKLRPGLLWSFTNGM